MADREKTRLSKFLSLVLRHSLGLVAVGLVVGLALLRLADAALARVLYEVSPGDALSAASGSVVLLLAAVVACAPAALRAMRVDPVDRLRAE